MDCQIAYLHSSRLKIRSLFVHLHNANLLHNSPFERDILVQPGPPTLPLERRSLETPSFRLIDFGLTETLVCRKRRASNEYQEEFEFNRDCSDENRRVDRYFPQQKDQAMERFLCPED